MSKGKNRCETFKSVTGTNNFVNEYLALKSFVDNGYEPYSEIASKQMYANIMNEQRLVVLFQGRDDLYRLIFPKRYNKQLNDLYNCSENDVVWNNTKRTKLVFDCDVVAHCIFEKYTTGKKEQLYITGRFVEFDNGFYKFVSSNKRFTLDINCVKRFVILNK